MEYMIGGISELITKEKSANPIKVIQKEFLPIKKETVGDLNEVKNPKKLKKTKLLRSKNVNQAVELNGNAIGKSPKLKSKKFINSLDEPLLKQKVKKSKKSNKLAGLNGTDSLLKPENGTDSSLVPLKQKAKKRKLMPTNTDLADESVEETSPKKQKLSKNEQNAASRIKNNNNKVVKNSSEYKDKTLYVGNIPIKTSKEKIKKVFKKYGAIDSIRIRGIPVADPKISKKVAAIKKEYHPDRNTVYAFIRFKSSEDCQKAEAENGELFENHHLRVHCCESTEKPDESKAIFVGNLAFNAEEEELWNVFKPCGAISHVRIVRDGRTGMGKGFAYINFKDADSVQLALEMEKITLKNRELRISLSDINRAKKKIKKPRTAQKRIKVENADDGSTVKGNGEPKKKSKAKGGFGGTKFNDAKKKKKFSKATLQKKKLAKKLGAPKPEKP